MVRVNAPSVVVRRELFGFLSADEGSGVTLLSAPPGSGKTVLLRSWVEDAGLEGNVAWVSVERAEQDPQRFWLSVIGRLREAAGAEIVENLEPSPTFDGDALVDRLISELGALEDVVVLVIDDVHELRSPEVLRQLEALLDRRPSLLRVVIAGRRDPRLGLHRLRIAGQLAEIRGADLRFTLEETRELLAATGVVLSDASVARLQDRTEGWAAGLRLAAIALSGHPDPERFVAEFTGSERTVADYLFAEVLERQPAEARRLLLRTSILERVNGPLADLLTDAAGSLRLLQELEQANAFVVALDASRSWFRYHRLFADLLRLELERTEADMIPQLHRAAAAWYEENRDVVEAVRHAQAAEDWGYAARLVADHSASFALDGRAATLEALLAGFPPNAVSAEPELAVVLARGEVFGGSLADATAYITLAERNAGRVSDERSRGFELSLRLARLMIARRRGDFTSALDEAQPLLAAQESKAGEAAPGKDIRTAAFLQLGIVELWSARFAEAERHLQLGLELARAGGRPYLEAQCLSYLAVTAGRDSMAEAREHAVQAIGIAEQHGWDADRVAGAALVVLGNVDVWQGRFRDAEQWLERARGAVRADLEPGTGLMLQLAQGRLNSANGHYEEAAASYRAAVRLEELVVGPQLMTAPTRRLLAQTQMQLGDLEAARQTLAELSDDEEDGSDIAHAALAHADLAEGDERAAIEALAPVLDGSLPSNPMLLVEAFLVDAIARERLGERRSAESAVERALELAEPNGLIWPFVVTPVRDLLERHPRHGTAHGALLKDILSVISGSPPPSPAGEPAALREDLTDSELRVLRYLPSNLSAPEIGSELYLSVHTVKTHIRHIYAKLGVHRRAEAVERARELGLLASSSPLR